MVGQECVRHLCMMCLYVIMVLLCVYTYVCVFMAMRLSLLQVSMRAGVVCEPTGSKDEIQVQGNDLELVSSSGEWSSIIIYNVCTIASVLAALSVDML